jgi:two-component system response regulator MprA
VQVLIVDDEPAVVDALDRALVQEGYSVASAGDGRTALDQVESSRPDAVILDVMTAPRC